MNLLPQFYVISAARSECSIDHNVALTLSMEEELVRCGMIYRKGIGSYKGVREESFVVVTSDEPYMLALAQRYRQESVLAIGPNREAELLYSNGQREVLPGKWVEVPEAVISNLEAYTYNGGLFYAVI